MLILKLMATKNQCSMVLIMSKSTQLTQKFSFAILTPVNSVKLQSWQWSYWKVVISCQQKLDDLRDIEVRKMTPDEIKAFKDCIDILYILQNNCVFKTTSSLIDRGHGSNNLPADQYPELIRGLCRFFCQLPGKFLRVCRRSWTLKTPMTRFSCFGHF